MESDSFSLFLVVILLLLTAFFVASEFAIVKIRKTRIEQLVEEGDKRAMTAKKILDNLDGYLSACQLGITITALGIGWLGEPAFAKLLEPLFKNLGFNDSMVHTISFVIAFSIITFLHVVLGELAPKTIAIQKAELMTLKLAKSLDLFYKLMYPIIWSLNGSANLLIKAFGFKVITEEEAHTPEEIKMILSNSSDLGPEEQKMLTRIFDFQERFVREIMVHRKDMDCIYLADLLEENIKFVKASRHSRFPICGDDKDDIKGYINVKDLYKLGVQNSEIDLKKIIRDIPKIYEMKSISQALKRMQKGHHQIAIVIDEYGGVSGLVTIEDILEEIVGEIQDEFDDEIEPIRKTQDKILVDGGVLIDEVNNELGTSLEEIDGIDTIGGYILTKIENPPKVGQMLEIGDYKIKILETDENRIYLLEFKKIEEVKEK